VDLYCECQLSVNIHSHQYLQQMGEKMSVFTQLYDFISSMDHSMRHFEDVSVVALFYAITIDKLKHSVFFFSFVCQCFQKHI